VVVDVVVVVVACVVVVAGAVVVVACDVVEGGEDELHAPRTAAEPTRRAARRTDFTAHPPLSRESRRWPRCRGALTMWSGVRATGATAR
jgi:hypothetical protein